MIFYLAYTSPANSKFLATYLRLLDVSLLSGRLNILYIFQITMRWVPSGILPMNFACLSLTWIILQLETFFTVIQAHSVYLFAIYLTSIHICYLHMISMYTWGHFMLACLAGTRSASSEPFHLMRNMSSPEESVAPIIRSNKINILFVYFLIY